MKTLKGVCHFHSETGTEGGYWAFQDAEFITPPNFDYPDGRWSYEGLHVLEDGDELTIYSKDRPDETVWSGMISLTQYDPSSQQAFGFNIHADQSGMDRQTWALFFFGEFPAKLVLGPKHTEVEHE